MSWENLNQFKFNVCKTSIIKPGNHAVVLEYVGRPFRKIDTKISWFDYIMSIRL